VTLNGAYLSNIPSDQTGAPSNVGAFSIRPNFLLSRSTSRQQVTLTYNPSILIYEPAISPDIVDQDAAVMFQERLSPTVTVSLQDSFYKTSDVFDESYTFSEGGVTGSSQTPTAVVIAPYADQLNNTAHADFSYQFGRDGMVGAEGFYTILSYPKSSSSPGLSNFTGGGASAFYNRRLTSSQYMGFKYEYARSTGKQTDQQSGTLTQSVTQTHSIVPFYSLYLTKTLSFSVAAGIQRIDVTVPQSPDAASWSPSIDASMGWQSSRVSVAANYLRFVDAGEGLLGAYSSNGFNASAGWRFANTWTGSVSAYYANLSNETPQLVSFTNGSSVSAQASLSHPLGQHFTTTFGYARIHENFPSIAAISADFNTDSASASISYEFQKPLER
jgi:hypothetical protein